MSELHRALQRCTFPDPAPEPTPVAFSGGPDSTALILLASASGLSVIAHHVDHGHRAHTAEMANRAAALAADLGIPFVRHTLQLDDGPNFEARARAVRHATLPDTAMFGHTLDDRAETVVMRLLRGSGSAGLAVLAPGPNHPIVGLRRADTIRICEAAGVEPCIDPSNTDPAYQRNRVRHEALPLLNEIADRDIAPLLARHADLAAADNDLLESLAAELDPTSADQIAAAHPAVARRAVRAWICDSVEPPPYPPDLAAINRVLAVARGDRAACEISGGLRIERSQRRLRIVSGAR